MTPLADTHVHLLAGLDDGPPTPDVALAMCRMLLAEGARHATALAHQNPHYPANTADHLRTATAALKAQLAHHKLPLAVYPTGEVMVSPSLVDDWLAGTLLSVGDHRQFLLVEMPHGQTINLLPLAEALAPYGVRLILAHAERYELLLDDLGLCAKWIEAGVLFQVTARALAEPWEPGLEVALKRWAKGGFIHLLGSDGHGIDRRRPALAGGFGRLAKWLGRSHAARVAGEWGRAVLEGRPIDVPKPRPERKSWFTRVFGG